MNLEGTMKVSNVVAAVAGGLVLGAAVFMPIGANALNQEAQQVTQAQEKIAATASDQQITDVIPGDVQVDAAAVDPISEVTTSPAPIATTPTFSSDDDDEDSNDDDSYGEDSEDDESDD
jgi:hypothetical protein